MGLVSLLQRQVESRAETICRGRNQNLPAELGKAIFEPIENGVVFFKQHYLLDSAHCDYTSQVAKVHWDETNSQWCLFIADTSEDDQWLPYPYLAQSTDLTAIMRELDKDPKSLFWDD
ncbi:DUF3024 domain-containing protein [Vibrio panuliri]|uniref:DUF3024 domain-containing protein n=1 Tax=Vibrio panuliri TaxID=1381081 RepID=A0A1Q9HHP1_9VIBR|nr:DUF3024 domain-containing protein [Vibrio panuliri]KAB1457696.1 DUF3024 domain-containing protein [Vibrio panuliri]OLQ89646.1 hypothetical protein BIY22_19190 [Vibrio panuliri]OLQ96406.1 hypothetical protein BIY20_19135 [Vibrio panuliri]